MTPSETHCPSQKLATDLFNKKHKNSRTDRLGDNVNDRHVPKLVDIVQIHWMQLGIKKNWKYKLGRNQLRTILKVAYNVIKQPSKLKTKHWFNKKCAEVIKLRNDSRLKKF